MNTNKDAWRYWYPRKEDTVEEDMPKLAKLFKETGVSRILDLGCGTGRHIAYFAQNRFEVYGFDFSRYAIRRAAERLENKKLRAHLKVWDMTKRFPYPDDFFHAVISTKVIHHTTVKVIGHIVSEVSRTTKWKGYFYAQVPTLERILKHEKISPKEVKWMEPGTSVSLAGEEKGVPHHGFTRQEILDLLGSHSFEAIETHEINEHFHVLAIKKKPLP